MLNSGRFHWACQLLYHRKNGKIAYFQLKLFQHSENFYVFPVFLYAITRLIYPEHSAKIYKISFWLISHPPFSPLPSARLIQYLHRADAVCWHYRLKAVTAISTISYKFRLLEFIISLFLAPLYHQYYNLSPIFISICLCIRVPVFLSVCLSASLSLCLSVPL